MLSSLTKNRVKRAHFSHGIKNMNIIKEIHEHMRMHTEKDRELVARAYAFGEKAGSINQRAYDTSFTLLNMGMDSSSISAGLLYNVLQDTSVSEEVLRKELGREVAILIKNVTALSMHRYHGLERHKESLRKLLLATSEDVRVLIIKLAERLNRFETLNTLPKDKQMRTALETLEIYAPIAHRLGIGHIKGTLEDLAFPYVYPKEYEQTRELLKERRRVTEGYLKKVHHSLVKALAKEDIKLLSVDHRTKHTYSLYKKLKRYKMDSSQIYDIAALRIVVTSIQDCYRSLGIIHDLWEPIGTDTIKDYVASPKPNGYQSIHTTVRTGDGGIVEIQVRTQKMHRNAEYGIASHLAYKESSSISALQVSHGKKLAWTKEFTRWQKKLAGGNLTARDFRVSFFNDRVFVFTPDGDVIDLPEGSTTVDFAYTIHSEVGNKMSGAKINGKLSQLNTPLKNGDKIEIITKKTGAPTPKWLEYATIPIAKKHIRSSLQRNM
jgi:GTP diphosphokinase / guanosine-3',5'-bis(diphosphate) 3'-diphosphatase